MGSRFLRDVQDVFWTRDGLAIKNLAELADALQGMSYATYSHHVTANKNDFANWIKFTIGDYELARRVAAAKTQEACHKAVASRVKELSEKRDETATTEQVRAEDKPTEGHTIEPQKLQLKDELVDFLLGLVIGFIIGIIVKTIV